MAKTGVMLEVRGTCGACGGPLAVGALVPQLPCPACNHVQPVSPESWEELLEGALREAPPLEPNRGRTTTTRGRGFTVTYGHLGPHCVGCQTDVPPEDLDGLAARGFGFCTTCGMRLSCRRAPEGVAPVVPPSAILVGEDADQIAGEAPGPERRPVTTASRWFIWFEPAGRSFAWNDIEDVAIDGQGNLYCSGKLEGTSSANMVFSVDPELQPRWVRRDVTLDDHARVALAPSGRLLVGDQRQRALLALSSVDGTTVGKVGGTGPKNSPGILDFEGAHAFAVDTDGTIIVLARDCLRRYSPAGREVEPWPGVRPARPAEGGTTAVDELSNQPVQLRTERTQVSIGWDGFTYFESGGKVAKLDRQGRVIYKAALQLSSVRGRPRAPTNGWLNVLGKLASEELQPLGLEDAFALVIVSPDGRQQRRSLLDQGMGGPLGAEEHIAITPEGFIWLLDHGGRARLLGPDGGPRFVSEPSRAKDEERRRGR